MNYDTIAFIISELPTDFGMRESVAKHFATEFAKANSRFKSALFLKACGVELDEGDAS